MVAQLEDTLANWMMVQSLVTSSNERWVCTAVQPDIDPQMRGTRQTVEGCSWHDPDRETVR